MDARSAWTKERRKKHSLRMKKAYENWWTKERRENQSKKLFKFYKDNPEQKIVLSKLGKISSDKFWKGNKDILKKKNELRKEKISLKKKLWWASINKKTKDSILKKLQSGSMRDVGGRMLKRRASMKKHLSSPVYRERMSLISKKLWADPEYRLASIKRMHSAMNSSRVGMNKIENKMFDILKALDYKPLFTGNRVFWVGGLNPDFIFPGTSKAIDVFGDYWHRGENPSKRIKSFKEFGYDLMVVWEKEVSDSEGLKQRILKFMGKP